LSSLALNPIADSKARASTKAIILNLMEKFLLLKRINFDAEHLAGRDRHREHALKIPGKKLGISLVPVSTGKLGAVNGPPPKEVTDGPIFPTVG
jgi:hypothetical protein